MTNAKAAKLAVRALRRPTKVSFKMCSLNKEWPVALHGHHSQSQHKLLLTKSYGYPCAKCLRQILCDEVHGFIKGIRVVAVGLFQRSKK